MNPNKIIESIKCRNPACPSRIQRPQQNTAENYPKQHIKPCCPSKFKIECDCGETDRKESVAVTLKIVEKARQEEVNNNQEEAHQEGAHQRDRKP